MSKKIAVILSGCGYLDGAEIHESTLTLWAIHKHGADFSCFAPDMNQHHVVDHLQGTETGETRNVLTESARIARGNISPLAEFDAQAVDALILPGGFGAAKNLSTFAFDGPECTVLPDVAAAITSMHEAGKPVGALCISPVLVAKVLGKGTLTIGQDQGTAEALTSMGASHQSTMHGEIVVDEALKLVTTPCYMLDARVDEIGTGAEKLVEAVLALT